jgi:transcription-repair coupling factor (superfamily II helicase)
VFAASDSYEKFNAHFPYMLTQDQESAIFDITEDLAGEKVMDRLICGDVGFGKTEVAMRAAFLITHEKKGQVAIVVPTTILARQHFNSFTERFKNEKQIVIKELSRNISKKEGDEIKEFIALGEIDILIGTHSLFSEKLVFKNLQLLVIDEEQHFGVKQKEKLKEGKEGIHFLALSATPIPRTLQMSLAGIRDISIITTPPFDRLLPKTFLMPYDIIVLSAAIQRERERLGRTFFVCPRISDLEEQKARLEQALPNIKCAIAHGRMKGSQIEDVMLKFYEGVYDVLITTSIIESGIDISFANTIIIYKAEMFGLAALYQLRGRVGRSSVQSYAYFIIDEKKVLEGSPAYQRLQALVNIKSLGGGFNIAGADMDIRGAGNLVGEEQSGKINEVGVELYQEMLAEAVKKIKSSEGLLELNDTEELNPEIKIGLEIMIPENYIEDFSLRLEFYRRISLVLSMEELQLLQEEMEDRFGKLPPEAGNLIKIIELKIRCRELQISKLEVGSKGIQVTFAEHRFLKGEKLLEFIGKNPKVSKVGSEGKVHFYDDSSDLIKKANKVLNLIKSL